MMSFLVMVVPSRPPFRYSSKSTRSSVVPGTRRYTDQLLRRLTQLSPKLMAMNGALVGSEGWPSSV